ncbi:MAG: NAD(P)-dependent oxidoreductase [Lachnospiraceae bacterium]|nr:NAD(P)-dependent oxidoreductase [Lachnospiraceae bacterium]
MRVLVTGSNGFIGKYICEYYKKDNYVIGVGRRETSVTDVDEYIKCDFANDDIFEVLDPVFAKGIDYVIHVAADNRVEPMCVEVVKSNCIGTQALLELSEKSNVKKYVQLSSVPVIGSPEELPVSISSKINPPTVYHATKYFQEILADYAYRKHGLRTVSIRIPSPMAPGVTERYIFPTFIRKAIAGEDLEIYGSGTRKQTYIHVSDIVNAIDLAVKSDCVGAYVLGSHNLISNIDLAKKVIEVLNSSSNIVYNGKDDPYDSQEWQIDYKPFSLATGYEAKVLLEEMIKEYRDYIVQKD